MSRAAVLDAPGPTAVRAQLTRAIEWGFFLTLPVERAVTFDVSTFTVRPVYFFMAAFLALHLGYLREGLRAMPTAVLVAVAVLLSLPTTYSAKLSGGYALWAFFTIAFALAAVGFLRMEPDRLRRWVTIYVLTAAAWAGGAVAQWLFSFAFPDIAYGWIGSVPRVHALTFEPSFFAFYLAAPLLLSAATRLWPASLLLIAGILMSTSRTGLVGILAGTAVLVALSDRTSRIRAAKGLAVAVVVFAIQVIPSALDYNPEFRGGGTVEGNVGEFITKSVDVQETSSISPRLQTWKLAWEEAERRPVNGVGVGALGAALQERGAITVPPEMAKTSNLWLEALAEMGIIGLLALLAWALAPLPGLWSLRGRDPLVVPLLAALAASMVMFAFIQTWWVPYRWTPWLIAYALAPLALETLRRRRTAA